MVGRYLCNNTCDSISLERILKEENFENLKKFAETAIEKNMLYKEWCNLYNLQIPKIE